MCSGLQESLDEVMSAVRGERTRATVGEAWSNVCVP